MPRTPRTALAEAMKDPLIAALVGKMPMPTSIWPKQKRTEWLELLSRAFNQIYEDAPPVDVVNGVAVAGAPAAAPAKYYILPDGTAMADNRMIDANQIPQGTVVLDYRAPSAAGRWDDDINPIMWLTHGAKLVRPPPGVKLKPADGPLPALNNGSGEAGAGVDA
jgi:hypothetical protein